MDISAHLAHRASWTPGKTALRFEGRALTYADLEQAVSAGTPWLRAQGVGVGDRVAFLGPNCPELVEMFHACARRPAVIWAATWIAGVTVVTAPERLFGSRPGETSLASLASLCLAGRAGIAAALGFHAAAHIAGCKRHEVLNGFARHPASCPAVLPAVAGG